MNYRAKNLGFSALEMLISMTVLTVVLGAIILVTFGNQSLFTDSETNSEALNKAQELLEQQESLARKDFKLVNPVGVVVDDIYQKSISVSSVDFFTKKVVSSVTWIGDHNKTNRVDLTSLVTNFENAVGGDTCYSVLTGDWTKPKVINTGRTDLATIVGEPSGSYPVTDIDAYQQKLYVTVNNSTTSSVGPNNPSTTVDASGVGTFVWQNPNNSKTSDNNRTTVNMVSGNVTHYLKATNFGFSIPASATITGIKVEIERSINGSTTGGVKDKEVKIIKADGTISVNNKADTSTAWPVVASEAYALYNPTDLWGETWSPAAINSSNFGVAISASATSSRTAQIDNVRITVSYMRQFYGLNISDPTNPTLDTSLGSNPTIKTGFNAVATVISSTSSVAYVATNSSTGQLEIIDLDTTPYSVISTMKIGATTGVGNAIAYKDGYVYMGLTHNGVGPEFNIIDVHNPINPSLVGSATVGNDINSIYVKNNYAYVASPNVSDLLIYDVGISKLSPTMTSLSGFAGTGGLHGKSVYVVGDKTYLGRTFGTNEFYILDTSNISSPSELGHRDLGSTSTTSANGLIIRDYLSFILNTAGQFQVWRTNNPASITRYDTTSVIVPNVSGNKTSLDCEGNNFFTGSTDASGKGYITAINTSF